MEVTMQNKVGERIPVLLCGSIIKKSDCPHNVPLNDCPVFKEKGKHCEKLEGIVLAAKDITAFKIAEEEKEKLHAQLLQSQKMESMGILANGIAHNFNNILGAIRGYADMAYEDIPPDKREHYYLKQIIDGSDDAKELIAQMLAFGRKDK